MATRTYDFSFDCPMPAQQVFGALTDFGPNRPQYFPNLNRGTYKVLEQTDDSALVVEGTPPFVTQERYHWTKDGRIWSVVAESNVLAPGCLTDIHVTPVGRRSCRLNFHLEREYVGGWGRFMGFFVAVNRGRRFYRKLYIRTLKNVQRAERRGRRK